MSKAKRTAVGSLFLLAFVGSVVFLSLACATTEVLTVELKHPSEIRVRAWDTTSGRMTVKSLPGVTIDLAYDQDTIVDLIIPRIFYSKLFTPEELNTVEAKYGTQGDLIIKCSLRPIKVTDSTASVQLSGKTIPVKFLLKGEGDGERLAQGTIEAAILYGSVTTNITMYNYTVSGSSSSDNKTASVELVKATLSDVSKAN